MNGDNCSPETMKPTALITTGLAATILSLGAATPDFTRDIQPILADHCFHCHGQDDEGRKGGLRLDMRNAALKGGKSGDPAIVPGQPARSTLLQRISADDDDVMPPLKEKHPVRPADVEMLRAWIEAGAPYQSHWAFSAPVKAPPPMPGNAVDAFVLARLAKDGLHLSAEAAPEKLCRRIFLDLIGLPPSPSQLDEFLLAWSRDRNAACTNLIEMLLASPHYGEKWARHWLDAARYADSDGYEKDLPREQWAWREWVINAFNADKPYDQFLIEQIAGDLLPNPTQEQRVATGFLRNGMVNEEGAIVAEQFRMEGMFDRMDCIGKAVLGISTQCAQCHTHKFDPLTQSEYYQMFACLNNTYEAKSWVYDPAQRRKIDEIRAAIGALEARLKLEHPDWPQQLDAWAKQQHTGGLWELLDATEQEWVNGLVHPEKLHDKSILTLGHRPFRGELFVIAEPRIVGVTGLRLEALTHGDLPFGGPGRSSRGSFAVSELRVETQAPGEKEWTKLALTNATADFAVAEHKLEPEFRDADGDKDNRRVVGPVAFLIDGNDDTAWCSDRGPGRRNTDSQAVVQFVSPQTLPKGTRLRVWVIIRHSGIGPAGIESNFPGRFRLALTTDSNPQADPLPAKARAALMLSENVRTLEQQAALFTAWRSSVPTFAAANEEIERLWQEYPEAKTSVLNLTERSSEHRRATFRLDRGVWDKPRERVEPGVPAFMHSPPAGTRPGRLALAQWLADKSSPLTARVAVNRVWQALFGTGIVETAEDFGVRSSPPSHPELLDWLAVDFMEHGWSQKELLRLIVSSRTYRQSSRATPERLARDPSNHLLARGPRFRADAEVVRDIVLGASGLLNSKFGGPSIFPPVPESLRAASFSSMDFWNTATGPERYCRSLYVFRRRSIPDPVLGTLDAPSGDLTCVRRQRSNTPLAMLATLNEPVFVEAARALALRVLGESGPDDSSRINHVYRLCVARLPKPSETQAILNLLRSSRARLADGWLPAREIVSGDSARLPLLPAGTTPSEAAAWTIAARVMLSLDETITKD